MSRMNEQCDIGDVLFAPCYGVSVSMARSHDCRHKSEKNPMKRNLK